MSVDTQSYVINEGKASIFYACGFVCDWFMI